MSTFLLRLAMLVMFLLGITCGWAALTMVFPASLFNILLGILALFFLLRGFELADRINNFGPYSEEEETTHPGNDQPDKEGHQDEDSPTEEQ